MQKNYEVNRFEGSIKNYNLTAGHNYQRLNNNSVDLFQYEQLGRQQ